MDKVAATILIITFQTKLYYQLDWYTVFAPNELIEISVESVLVDYLVIYYALALIWQPHPTPKQ